MRDVYGSNTMAIVTGLRSPYHKVGRIVYFGRMLDKIRLHAAGLLPEEYWGNLGEARPRLFDARCCRFLGVSYADLKARALASSASGVSGADADEALLAWCHEQGGARADEDFEIWNAFMEKCGWRDGFASLVRQRAGESGLEDKPIETMFDYVDFDEGRDPGVSRRWNEPGAIRAIVLMGVAGCGKTTIGRALAGVLGADWAFWDGDDFHPAANVAKMSSGVPLVDTDREPWLAALRERLERVARAGEGGAAGGTKGPAEDRDSRLRVVLACSALRECYRQKLTGGLPGVAMVYLKGSPDLLRARLEERARGGGHFMRPEMLESQLATLEEPASSAAVTVEVDQPVPEVVAAIRHALGLVCC